MPCRESINTQEPGCLECIFANKIMAFYLTYLSELCFIASSFLDVYTSITLNLMHVFDHQPAYKMLNVNQVSNKHEVIIIIYFYLRARYYV